MFGPVQSQWITSQAYSSLTEDTFLLQCLVVTVTAVSNAPKASSVVRYTMNNHTYPSLTTALGKALYQSCLEAKDTTQSFLEKLVGWYSKEVLLPSKALWMRGMCCSVARQ